MDFPQTTYKSVKSKLISDIELRIDNSQKIAIMKKIILSLALGTFFVVIAFAENNAKNNTIPLIGSKAPSFTAETTNGTLTFPDDYGKKWKILMSHPQDFTPVCSSELSELAYVQKDFEKLGVKLAIISTDNVAQHKQWKTWLEGLDYKGRGPQKIDFPIIDDESYSISKQYGMIHAPVSTTRDIRGVFIIDPNNIVRSVSFYPMEVGRNMKEVERIVMALQKADENMVYTPVNWKEGDDVIVPYFPYTNGEFAVNPELKNEYYNVGGYLWFKRVNTK